MPKAVSGAATTLSDTAIREAIAINLLSDRIILAKGC